MVPLYMKIRFFPVSNSYANYLFFGNFRATRKKIQHEKKALTELSCHSKNIFFTTFFKINNKNLCYLVVLTL